jgi:16S rRNA (cytidine1402-2'-O)-methyltransferase
MFYVVATPIGNMGDITIRAKEILSEVDFVLTEDTRVGGKLLFNLGIKKELINFHEHSEITVYIRILELLKIGKKIALITDAGTPNISDPGGKLLAYLYENMDNFQPFAIPGASAVISALSISGFRADKFLFLGFPPIKNKRKQFFDEIREFEYTTAFYESCYRIKKSLSELKLGDKRKVCICRELTKKFETVYRGSYEEVMKMKILEKGEFVVIVEGFFNGS